MEKDKLLNLLKQVRREKISPAAALQKLKSWPFVPLFQKKRTGLPMADYRLRVCQHAMIDTHRALRCGFPEVIFCQGKMPHQIEQIARRILKHHDRLLATRADEAAYRAIRRACAGAVYHKLARVVTVNKGLRFKVFAKGESASRPYGRGSPMSAGGKSQKSKLITPALKGEARPDVTSGRHNFILIITAGTADIPVAEEARITAEIMLGNQSSVISHQLSVRTLYDVGVAGIHRVLAHRELLEQARVIIVAAGMEGALASVVAGLVDKPVIAVPTSVGYGASFEGLAALLTMLNSCAAGVTVVNIDNGFGAGYAAALMMKGDRLKV